MKIVSYFILILIVLSNLVSNVTFFYVRSQIRQEAKREMKKTTNPNLLRIFRFTELEYKKVYFFHSKEFSYNGNMYDIVSQKKIEGIITIKCIIDYKEKEFLLSYVNNHKDFKITKALWLLSFIAFFNIQTKSIKNLFYYRILKIPGRYSPETLLNIIEKIDPPPENKGIFANFTHF